MKPALHQRSDPFEPCRVTIKHATRRERKETIKPLHNAPLGTTTAKTKDSQSTIPSHDWPLLSQLSRQNLTCHSKILKNTKPKNSQRLPPEQKPTAATFRAPSLRFARFASEDLKNANPSARISVKLVARIGIGVIASGAQARETSRERVRGVVEERATYGRFYKKMYVESEFITWCQQSFVSLFIFHCSFL